MDFEIKLADLDLVGVLEATQFSGYEPKADNKDGKMKLRDLTDVKLIDDQLIATLEPLSWNMIRISVAN
ncbi:hypothetical protein OXT66_00120 [Lentilactobacillus senioris]|uniref:hypothetical protein n=1 Tax=Lentilactobacillus senioris TaxID=931534 RepID=UPI00228185E5|nr:hypothetical protein [Lentilactobacillus senioris]MCY9805951.1 hypothetical protein [Lentilactobacillus senioris]